MDLMTQQMRGVHEPVEAVGQDGRKVVEAYNKALDDLYAVCSDKKAIHAVDNAVGGYLNMTEEVEYKNGFADAICMILQAAMHGK